MCNYCTWWRAITTIKQKRSFGFEVTQFRQATKFPRSHIKQIKHGEGLNVSPIRLKRLCKEIVEDKELQILCDHIEQLVMFFVLVSFALVPKNSCLRILLSIWLLLHLSCSTWSMLCNRCHTCELFPQRELNTLLSLVHPHMHAHAFASRTLHESQYMLEAIVSILNNSCFVNYSIIIIAGLPELCTDVKWHNLALST